MSFDIPSYTTTRSPSNLAQEPLQETDKAAQGFSQNTLKNFIVISPPQDIEEYPVSQPEERKDGQPSHFTEEQADRIRREVQESGCKNNVGKLPSGIIVKPPLTEPKVGLPSTLKLPTFGKVGSPKETQKYEASQCPFPSTPRGITVVPPPPNLRIV